MVYTAKSPDRYIAAPGDDLGFLSIMEQEGEDYGYAAFMDAVDTVIQGQRTIELGAATCAGFFGRG